MATVDDLVGEIEGIPSYLDESKKLVSDIEALKIAQSITIGTKVQLLKCISVPEATRLQAAIALVGWSAEERSKLSTAVDVAVSNSTPTKRPRRCSQQCPTWELYPTEADYELFGDCLLYTSPSPRDGLLSRMPSSA